MTGLIGGPFQDQPSKRTRGIHSARPPIKLVNSGNDDDPMHLSTTQMSSFPSAGVQILLDQFFALFNGDNSIIDPDYEMIYNSTRNKPKIPTTTESPIPRTTPFSIHDETQPYISAEKWYDKYLWWRIILVSYILILGLIGNSAIIYSVCKVPRFRSKPTNIFILNMAIGDLIASIFCPIVALIRVVNEFYVMGSFICRIEGFVKITCLFVSSYSLIVLSFQWLLYVVKPFWRRMTIVHSWIALGIIWTLSLAMGTPLIFYRELRSRKWANLVERWCQEDTEFITYYWITVCFALIYVPILCMTFALVIILIKMDKFGYKLRRSASTSAPSQLTSSSKTLTSDDHSHTIDFGKDSVSTATSNQINNNPTSTSSDHRIVRKEIRATTSVNMKYRKHIVSILLIYLVVSAVCWAPLNLSIIYRLTTIRRTFFPNSFNEFNFFCELGVATSSALNPIIFGFLSRPFRQVIKRLWNSIWSILCYSRRRKNVSQNQKHNNRSKKNIPMRRLNNNRIDHRRSKITTNIYSNNNHDAITRQNLHNSATSSRRAGSTTALVNKLISNQNRSRSTKRVTFESANQSIKNTSTHKKIISGPKSILSNSSKISNTSIVSTSREMNSPPAGRHKNISRVIMNPAGDSVSDEKLAEVRVTSNLNRQSSFESMESINIEAPICDESLESREL